MRTNHTITEILKAYKKEKGTGQISFDEDSISIRVVNFLLVECLFSCLL